MTTLIAFTVAALAILGLMLVVAPALLLDAIREQHTEPAFRITAITARLVVGMALLLLADASRFPLLITIIATLSLVSGLVFAFMRRESFVRMMAKVLEVSAPLARLGGVSTLVLAWFLAWAIL